LAENYVALGHWSWLKLALLLQSYIVPSVKNSTNINGSFRISDKILIENQAHDALNHHA